MVAMNSVPPESSISDSTLLSALEALRARIGHFVREREALDRSIAAAREEETLLERLLAIRRGESPRSEAPGTPEPLPPPSQTGAGHPAVQAVVRELETAGRPLHISDLMRLLRQQGITIPGSGTQANLIAHLRRDKRIVRPSRGVYGLIAWGLESMPSAPRKAGRRKRRMRAVASEQGAKT